MNPIRRVFAIWMTFFLVVCAHADDSQPMQFTNLSLEDGLSQNTVLTVLQDSRGFMWFGTENGLNRYDGNEFRRYQRSRDGHGLASDMIFGIAEDSNGNLWLVTEGGGLTKLDVATDEFTVFRHDATNPNGLATNNLRALEIDSKGRIWIGTRNNGVERFDPATGQVSHFTKDPSNGLPSNEINDVLEDRNGRLWFATEAGLSRYDEQSGTFFVFANDPAVDTTISENRVRVVSEDHKGDIWAGTRSGGLNRLNKDGRFTRFQQDPENPASLSSNSIRAILEDSANRLWIGTPRGLNLFDETSGSFAAYRKDAADPVSLSDNNVMSIYQDRSDVLWVGTRSGGVNKWNPRSWSFGHFEGDRLSSGHSTSFAYDSDGKLWVGTFGGGLNIIDRQKNTIEHLKHDPNDPNSLSDDRVMAILADSSGILWVGTMRGGLNKIDPKTRVIQSFRHDPSNPDSLSANGVMALFEDRHGALWIGTFGGGANRMVDGTFERFMHDPGKSNTLSSPRATSFAEDARGTLWIGTDGGGLDRFDRETGTFQSFRHNPDVPSSLSSDTVYALHASNDGSLWIGTQGGGLDHLLAYSSSSDVRFENLTQADGLANNVIYGIHADNHGTLWLSTNHGLGRYDPNSSSIKNYHRSHGLQGEEFNFGAHYRSNEGELFFGGANGFNAFFPDRLESNRQAPPVVLTSFLKFNSPMETDVAYSAIESIDLGYKDDVITFEFAGLDFTAPEQNQYAYMLAGFDTQWHTASHGQHATYTNLDGGEYVFRVRASNSDGVWNEEGVSVRLSVAPAPWNTWWAYTLYGLATFTLLFSIWRNEKRKLAREEEYSHRLEEEVREQTRELAGRNADLRVANYQLEEASATDPLTGLRNRRFLFEHVSKDIDLVLRKAQHALDTSVPFDGEDMVFLMIDLDHFKPINDNCGHTAGDRMLLQIRDALMDASRKSDYVIRWGGDEFLVVGRNTEPGESERLAERIRRRIANQVFALGDGQVARTTCSIGFASFPFMPSKPNALSWEQVVSFADAALYEAKETRNSWVGYRGTPTTETVEDLYETVRQNRQELEERGFIEVLTSPNLHVESRVG